jgi:hypothetical protein
MSRFAICAAGLLVNAFLLAPAWQFIERGQTDFMPLYAGGKLAFTGHLYDVPRQLGTEVQYERMSSPTRLFVRLPCFALFFRPLAQLPYPAASWLWEAIGLAAACACALMLKRPELVAWSLPLLMALAEGQDLPLILLAIAASGMLLRKRRPVVAGAIASLCLAKYHLFLLIPVWICARKQWRFAKGLAAGSAGLLALSFVAGGWRWPIEYLALIRQPSTNTYPEVMPNLHSVFGSAPLELAGVLVLGAAVWFASRKGSALGFAAALAAGVLAAPHAYMADGALMIPAAVIVLNKAAGWLKPATLYLASPIPWVLLMIGSGWPARAGLAALVFGVVFHQRKLKLALQRIDAVQHHADPVAN